MIEISEVPHTGCVKFTRHFGTDALRFVSTRAARERRLRGVNAHVVAGGVVRIGDRIAIMRDGRVVQIGTPEDIVMHPADEYVADFVAGISRLKVVRAHAVMQPLAEFEKANGGLYLN